MSNPYVKHQPWYPGTTIADKRDWKEWKTDPSSHQPFTLTWNGQHYVPDFVPTTIRVRAYSEKDYQEIKDSYLEAKRVADRVPGLESTINGLLDSNEYFCDKVNAYSKLRSALEYLSVSDRDNFSA